MSMQFRLATEKDLPEIVKLLADDEFGSKRETYSLPVPSCYVEAFAEIKDSGNVELIVGQLDGRIVMTLQIFYLPHISLKGAKRGQIESVRVSSDLRSRGYGKQLMDFAMKRAREHGCTMLQFTSGNARKRAHRFYESMGFEQTSLGYKISL